MKELSDFPANFDDSVSILCVDDEPSYLTLLKVYLEKENDLFRVITSNFVQDALDKLESELIDIIVADYRMPLASGLELLEILRNDGNDIPTQVVIRVTNLATGETRDFHQDIKVPYGTNTISFTLPSDWGVGDYDISVANGASGRPTSAFTPTQTITIAAIGANFATPTGLNVVTVNRSTLTIQYNTNTVLNDGQDIPTQAIIRITNDQTGETREFYVPNQAPYGVNTVYVSLPTNWNQPGTS